MGVTIWVDKTHKNRIYLSINENCRQRRIYTGLHLTDNPAQNREIKKMAEMIRSKVELQRVAHINGFITEEEERLTVCEYTRRISDEKGKQSQFYKLLPYLEKYGDRKLISCDSHWFQNFQSYMEKDTGLSPATAERYTCRLREVFKLAVRDNILLSDPSDGIKHIRVPESTRPHLVEDEIRALVATELPYENGDELKRAFLFATFTGLRFSDIQTLTWGDIDLSQKQVAKRMVKTKTVVYVPLTSDAIYMLGELALHKSDEPVFPYVAQADASTNRRLKKWGVLAGLEKPITWHVARHTLATQLIESGADLYTVQRTLGHSKSTTTEVYAKVSDRKKREAMENLPDYGVKTFNSSK